MAIRVALNHKTSYRYPRPVWLSPQVLRLRPAPHCRTPVLSYSLNIKPEKHFINWMQDPYSNRLARVVFPVKTCAFSVEVDLVVELTVVNPFDFFLEKEAEQFPFQYDVVLQKELVPYREIEPAGPLLTEYLSTIKHEKTPTVNFLVALNARLCGEIKYLIRLEPGIQPTDKTLGLRTGSCRDSAWLMVQILRHLGLAARFVSGYLIQLTPDVKSLDGPVGASTDFTDLHAWTEVYLPGAGWIGLDPTSGLFAGEGHIPLACSADPITAAAITGFYSNDTEEVVTADPEDGAKHGDGQTAGQEGFDFSMSVTRIHEDPRVTKPYTDMQWAEIEALGRQVDAELNRGDVRLTMGGEPTFVSIDDVDSPEWNSAALGPKKYKLGDELVRRLRDRFAPGGFLHHGQGKWYPGESLPRWALGLYFRRDGQPIWKNQALVADEQKAIPVSENEARDFAIHLSERLGVESRFLVPGYEDAWYYMWKERRLPINVDPLENNLESAEERARLAKVFEQGLDKVVGYALPLKRVRYIDGSGTWVSGPWFFRPERMYLIPGDSPMGYRLPLDSIPFVVPGDLPYPIEQDPWADRPLLPPRDAISSQNYLIGPEREPRTPPGHVEQILELQGMEGVQRPGDAGERGGKTILDDDARGSVRSDTVPLPAEYGEFAANLVRTALCVQVRKGVLRVFMPPVQYMEDYLELVAAIEDTSASLKLPVLVEGYTPPRDHRVNIIKVTPDPGVIEVNAAPVESWDELVRNTTALYEEARLTRLGTEKFMTDGRHTGTGGGNHIVIGGTTPADSPLLRRPDLLGSLLTYWHNHPSLSYLFSGLFVGPTSQAPRTDEARNDQVYELELAMKQIPENGYCPPWIVDRIFRNLLVDSTGNTHRAEFCIDKLYAPESSTGRLGLLEMRAFEMPPHARMSLTQQLLLRALIALFWKQPYKQRLVRWGTEIHDRYLLPHFVHQDLDDVVFELNSAGYPLKTEWFAPHIEFRFPLYGSIQQRGIDLELRQAIEPWHVLGEEPSGSGTVRYVDSSVERLQVLVGGMTDSRHIITCNNVRVPLHPTGMNGQFVAGIRYKAWKPPGSLHPTIEIDSPLVFDVVDSWIGRSIGGCTYHVVHPGGRSYDHFPVNAYEAESRRIARFNSFGHTPGQMRMTEPPRTDEYPMTLDLRRG
ncbi:MAG: transglutaminase family protein [Planctomycetota bacterium]|nr:transglutaminase family protein [Planctomycetota bacterium]